MENVYKSHKPCLILNQDYSPLLIINWQRALCQQIIGKEMTGEGIRILEYYEDDIVKSAGGDFFPIPAVAVTGRYIKRRRRIALKKRNLLIRDRRLCQYCGHEVTPKTATIDHIIPKSRFAHVKDAHTWKNTVIACISCNSKKDNRTPSEACMKLLSQPHEPDHATFYAGISAWREMPNEWRKYIEVQSLRSLSSNT